MPEPDAPVDLVLAFLNTLDVEEGTDELSDDAGLTAWIASRPDLHDVQRTRGDLAAARGLRDHLRRTARGEPVGHSPSLDVQVRLDPAGARLTGSTVHGRLAAAVATLALQGRLERVKICPADDCRYAFYDRSRNGSRQWCSMRVCGNRAKARNHRLRAASDAAGGTRPR